MNVVDRVPISPPVRKSIAFHDPAQEPHVIITLHRDAVCLWIKGISPAIFNIPNLVSELLKPQEIVHRLPGDAGEWHLPGEMENDDVATLGHDRSRSGLAGCADNV